MKKLTQLSLLVLTLQSASLLAAEPNFSYLQIGSTEQEYDTINGDFSGYEIAASYQLEDDFFIVGKAVATKANGLDMQTKTIGIGYHYPLLSNTKLILQLDAVGVVFNRPNAGEFDEQGKQFSIGIKSQLTQWLELEVSARRIDAGQVDVVYGDYEIDYTLVGLNFSVSKNFALYVDFETEDNSERMSFGLRYDY
jgi:predicted porin